MGIKFIIFTIPLTFKRLEMVCTPGNENLAGASQNSVYHRTQEVRQRYRNGDTFLVGAKGGGGKKRFRKGEGNYPL